MKNCKQKILACLENATMPLDVENIRVATGIGNWNTVLKHCLELLIQEEAHGQRTSRGWIFWSKHKEIEKQ
jgi:hypothetical protein